MGADAYLQDCQRLLRDQREKLHNLDDLLSYVNRARRMVAFRAECCEAVSSISGEIESWSVTNAGSGYSASPTFTVSAPDFPSGALPYPNGRQATANGIVSSGSIAAIFSSDGGAGYFQPTLTITDSTGTGAAASPVMKFVNTLNRGQEQYPFAGIDISNVPGADRFYGILSLTNIFSNYRTGMGYYDFDTYQTKVRLYPIQYQYVPAIWSQQCWGTDGKIFVYPLPSQTYQYEVRGLVLPQDLVDDSSPDIVPAPWNDAVVFYALHLAFLEQQQFNAAKFYFELFDKLMPRFKSAARPWRVNNPYGRY